MRRRARIQIEEDTSADDGELNLVPYLDIITALVMFLIFTFQVMIEFRLIELMPPAYNADGGGENAELALSVVVDTEGILVASNQPAIVPGSMIPKANGAYDLAALKSQLSFLKQSYALGPNLVLSATSDIEYSHVVATMDAVREDSEGKPLFPDVLLSVVSMGGGQ